MKKRICACLLAAVMTAILSISSFATPSDMGPRMSLSSTMPGKEGDKGQKPDCQAAGRIEEGGEYPLRLPGGEHFLY